jgi:DNA-binding NtrC family response regulator
MREGPFAWVGRASSSACVNIPAHSTRVKRFGAALAALVVNVMSFHGGDQISTTNPMILILSADAVGAALLGALIETLGYSVKFARPPENYDQALRRTRPKVCLIDCDDPATCNEEILGRATMRGISVVIFGTRDALESVRTIASEHDFDTLLVPPDSGDLERTLDRALKKAG